jgi:hypothetical protein
MGEKVKGRAEYFGEKTGNAVFGKPLYFGEKYDIMIKNFQPFP